MALHYWRAARLRRNVGYVRVLAEAHAEPQSWHVGINFRAEANHETV